MRPIDADALKEHMFYHSTDNTMYLEERDIDEAPTVAAPCWHRVGDELPEIGKSVLVCVCGYNYWLATRTDDEMWKGRRYWKNTDGDFDAVEDWMYWMPIEPPVEG